MEGKIHGYITDGYLDIGEYKIVFNDGEMEVYVEGEQVLIDDYIEFTSSRDGTVVRFKVL